MAYATYTQNYAGGWKSGGSGVVNTSGTAVTWVSGNPFDTTWTGATSLYINGTQYTISTVTSGTALTLTATAGTQTGVLYQAGSTPLLYSCLNTIETGIINVLANFTAHLSSGDHDTRYYTQTQMNAGQMDSRYYTQTNSDARYYTQTQSNTNFAPVLAGVPIGSVVAYAGSSAPNGWFECNGQTFSAGSYPQLNTVLGGTTVPDLRGQFVRGWDHGAGVDSGRTLNSTQADSVGKHTHSTSSNGGDWSSGGSSGGSIIRQGTSWTNDGTGGSPATGTETRPKNFALMYIIRHD